MNYEWAVLHASSTRSISAPSEDESEVDSVPLPAVSPVDRANKLVAVGELRRAGLALDSETHMITKSYCASFGPRGEAIWELCLKRVRELHPRTGVNFDPDSVPRSGGRAWCLGGLPPQLRGVHFGARLFCLYKGTAEQWERLWGTVDDPVYDDVLIRPVMVGGEFDKLVQTAQLVATTPAIGDAMKPLQYGVAVPSGMEMLVLANRSHAKWQPRSVTGLTDCSGAFPRSKRKKVGEGLVEYGLGSLYGYFAAGHSGSVPVFVDGEPGAVLEMDDGLFQGKVLASAYYCVSIQPLLIRLSREFPLLRVSAVVDDIAWQGNVPDARRAFAWLMVHGPEYGYFSNMPKCKLVLGAETINPLIGRFGQQADGGTNGADAGGVLHEEEKEEESDTTEDGGSWLDRAAAAGFFSDAVLQAARAPITLPVVVTAIAVVPDGDNNSFPIVTASSFQPPPKSVPGASVVSALSSGGGVADTLDPSNGGCRHYPSSVSFSAGCPFASASHN